MADVALAASVYSFCMVTVRKLMPNDFETLWPMFEDSKHIDSKEQVQERFQTFCFREDWFLLGAEQDGKMIGYAAGQDYGTDFRCGDTHRECKMHDLFVFPDFRRQGAGKALVEAAKEWARARSVRYFYWYASKGAIPFYEKLGVTGVENSHPNHPYFEVDFHV